jgi:hypothetical protein
MIMFRAYLQYRTMKYGTSQNWVGLTYNECKVILVMTDVTESRFCTIKLTSESFQHTIHDTQETLNTDIIFQIVTGK